MTNQKGKKMKRSSKKSSMSLINLKADAADRRELEAAARKYARGNLSAWLRYAGKHFKPTKNSVQF